MNEIKLTFDDFVKNDDGSYWGCICEECVKKYGVSEKWLDDAGQGICGVKGCENEADYYIDFPEMKEPLDRVGIKQIIADLRANGDGHIDGEEYIMIENAVGIVEGETRR